MRKALSILILLFATLVLNAQTWVRVNQLGYLPTDLKVAVMISTEEADGTFEVYNTLDDKLIFKGKGRSTNASRWGMKTAYRMDFTSVVEEGSYYIVSSGVKSPNFRISTEVYDGLADYMLIYMRQQRCGDNPFTDTLCHQHDGFIVDHPTRSGEKIDVRGGWHDATDYLQYVTTSATTAYHLLFAYQQQEDKSIFKDLYNAVGRPTPNGIPDILDEAKWGLDWLDRMNPEDKVMFNQVADDRDHAGFRYPNKDKVDYGWGPGEGRPVYFVTGRPQGLGKYINRTTGVSSTASKFASTFALGAELLKDYYPEFSAKIMAKAEPAFDFAIERPGNTQTACLKSPYFYEEDTFVDDIELAAATFYDLTKNPKWLVSADYWGELEPVTPWMELGRGRHYQYYPFLNLGHYLLASSDDNHISAKYSEFMRQGLQSIKDRASDDPFINGIPFLWCSNNLTSAAITQARLYHNATGDRSFMEMEAALRDWLFGCNPWGTSMIVGTPIGYDYPDSPHSSYTVVSGDLTYGGLVDGPIDRHLFQTRAGASLTKEDLYAPFNNGAAVYHDDIGDYATNEPTMDGTAGLTYYFAAMEEKGRKIRNEQKVDELKDRYGVVVRKNSKEKKIYFVFSADSNFVGGKYILKTLKKKGIKGSFFLTGNCLRMEEHSELIKEIIAQGHYVGAHSDRHLLYADWSKRDSSLCTFEHIAQDALDNMHELAKFGIDVNKAKWYLPPYEWYNHESVAALESVGLKVMNFTPMTATPADYTIPSMKNYKTSDYLIKKLYELERNEGLDGAIILIHPGILPERPDPLYFRLGEMINYLKRRGYTFSDFNL